MDRNTARTVLFLVWLAAFLLFISQYEYGMMTFTSVMRYSVRVLMACLLAYMALPELNVLYVSFLGAGDPLPEDVFPKGVVYCPHCRSATTVINGRYDQHWFYDEQRKFTRVCDEGTGYPYIRVRS